MKTVHNIYKWNKKLFWLLPLFLLGVLACREELAPRDFQMSELSVKTSDIKELLPGMYNSKYTFSWTAANNQGSNSSISYKLEIDKNGNNFAHPQVFEIGKNIYSYDMVIGDLNNLLVETYGATPGTPIEMQARVTATFGDTAVQSQSVVTNFSVTPFKPFTKKLYIVGDATPNGWDITKATELTRSATNPSEFVYYGQLKNGNFKFATSQDGCFCQDFYTKDPSDENKMVYNQGGSGQDLQWTVSDTALYKITVDVLSLTYKSEKMTGPMFSKIYIVGDASPSGWEINNPVEFKQDTENLFIFTLEATLKPGNFKILAGETGDWCGNWYRPLTDNQGLVDGAVNQMKGCDPDYKWKVSSSETGRYKIILNTSNNTIKFEPVNVYMLGDATPNGWNMGTLTPMQKNGSVYTWTGNLTAGSFKFAKFNTTWCDGTELVAVTADQSISNTTFVERVKCAGGDATDHKWKVKASEAGTRTFTLDLDTNTLTIQ